jgi:hypothetical protein
MSFADLALGAALRATAPRDRGLQVQEVEVAGAEFDELWEACAPAYHASIIRDRSWVTWRFLSAPHFRYRVLLATRAGRPAGYTAFRLEEAPPRRVGYVAEVFTSPGDRATLAILLRAAVSELRAAGAESVSTQAVPGTWLYSALRRRGFLLSRADFPVQWRPLDASLPFDILRRPTSWFMSGADYDSI